METRIDAGDGNAGAASQAVDAGKEVASTTADEAKQVVSTAADSTKQVASTAVDQTKQVAQEAVSQARDLVGEARMQARQQAQSQTEQVASGLRRVGDQARALAEGRAHEAGPVGDYARQAADKLSQLADQVQQRGFDGVLDDVKDFARRKPGTFLVGAAVAGFAVGRLARGAQGASQDEQNQQYGAPQYYGAGVPQYMPPATPAAPIGGLTGGGLTGSGLAGSGQTLDIDPAPTTYSADPYAPPAAQPPLDITREPGA